MTRQVTFEEFLHKMKIWNRQTVKKKHWNKSTKQPLVYLVQKCGGLGKTDREAKYEGRQWGTNFLLFRAGESGQKMTCVRCPILPNKDFHFSPNISTAVIVFHFCSVSGWHLTYPTQKWLSFLLIFVSHCWNPTIPNNYLNFLLRL